MGEVYEVDEPTLAALDRLESHPRFYRRTAIRLATGDDVETYLLTAQQVAGRSVIPSGSWRTRKATSRHIPMKIHMRDDRMFQGTPLQIVGAMQDIDSPSPTSRPPNTSTG